ncbi:MAG: hypothetical protein Q8P41_17120 [Pseudomonadota bacterium]|nr:hypothetical protein [Pseudomonadota bacterium]
MRKMTNLLPLGVLATMAVACGPKVEGPFEGEGEYEGRYAENQAPAGWGEADREEPQTARREEPAEGRSPPGWRDEEQTAQAPPRPAEEPAAEPAAPATDQGMRRERQAQAEPPEEPERRGTNGEVGEPMPAPSAELGNVIRQLRQDGEGIRGSTDLRHEDVIAALRTLAGGLATMPSSDAVRANVEEIQAYADRLATSDPYSPDHEELTQAALRQGAEALTTVAAMNGMAETLEPQLRRLRSQIDRIQAARPLLQQTGVVADAFGSVADTMSAFEQRARPPAGTR